ncbi:MULTISPECIES: Hsp70 family protein [Nostocales]|uniref:Hsp70 family protein n=3 Tax=Nostocales TaxID=1161 RepID=A0A0C1R2T5_9CYAN|nr:Hsp70 family protein [Tolypothrix bouteillei]KAF3890094.1 Hsp70 family protein [Tolypothrix bouteillei VB521301]
MSNWHLHLKRLFQALCRPLVNLLRTLQGLKNSRQRLAKTCEKLQRQLETTQDRDKAWQTYTQALFLARKCSDRQELTQVILKFDPLLGEQTPSPSLAIGQALSFLLEAKPQTAQNLDAAWRLSQRLPEPSSIQEIQQQICLQAARIGDSNLLLAKLLKRRQEGTLDKSQLLEVVNIFLENHTFQLAAPWKSFFAQLQPDELPKIHQVYALVDRYIEAADLAETAQDYRSAVHYLMPLAGQEHALRQLNLANRLGDERAIAQAHEKVAEIFWQDGDYTTAITHFQPAGNLERVSDCHQKLGKLGLAIQYRPSITPEWVQSIRELLENTVRLHIEHQEFLAAVQLLKSVATAWQEKSQVPEAERTQRLLSEAVRTARAALTAELSGCAGQSTTDLFKRWSLLEEAAGNYLEAASQAEKAQDYFAASVLFEKASAFGQALVALESASPEAVDIGRKAQLLEEGGDFFMAASLYEQLGETERAIALYAQAGEFLRAAELRQQQLGDEQAVFDRQFQELLQRSQRVEQLAQLCAEQANAAGQSATQKAKLWRRIKDLAQQDLLGQKWLDLVAIELPEIEVQDRRYFEEQATRWVTDATKQVLADYVDAIGLDLGTSNSVVCLYNKRERRPEVVERRRQRQIPSVFAIDQSGREIVGTPIAELLSKSPRAIITKAKRHMGTDLKFRAAGQEYRAEEISARIINCAREFAREYLRTQITARVSTIAARTMGSAAPADWVNEFLAQYPPVISLNNIVITVPAYFNEAQKRATKTAGFLADIRVLRLIHEPTAACLAQHIYEHKTETILVADLGAGTFDLSIIETGSGVFEVHQIEGDNTLGSADLDEIIYTHFNEFVKVETGQEIPRNSQAATRLRQACEELKIELSTQSEWTIDLPYLIGDRTIQLTLTRAELERLASPWLERIRSTCQKVTEKPTRVLLIGGGGLMPAVRQCIGDVFHLEPDSAYDPLTVVARGAALQAAILTGDFHNTLLLDVVPFSLGIKCRVESGEFQFSRVIPKHTTIPTDNTQRYTTTEDNQTAVRIEVFQGESSVSEENFKIGEFILQGIPIAPAGVPQIDVKFAIDANCLLTVTARDVGTGNEQSITIADSHLLTPAQMTSLQSRFRDSQLYQKSLSGLEKLMAKLQATLHDVETADVLALSTRFQDRFQTYERHRERYSPTSANNNTLFDIYRDRIQLENNTRLALDQWNTLSRSIRLWLDGYKSLDWRATEITDRVQRLLEDGEQLLQRAEDAKMVIIDIAANYQRWLSVLENLPINLEGQPQELAQHFLRLQRYSEALTQFERLAAPLSSQQVELGLEILARLRQREAYTTLLREHAAPLGVHQPDFANLNHAVRIYTASVVWIHVDMNGWAASGSGFVIGSRYIATNRHVLINEKTGNCVPSQAVRVITNEGALEVVSIHLPSWGADDVAILEVQPVSNPLTPLRLGFSELVEVGERIVTVGFPSPESGGFVENLYCNIGLINRVRPSPLCSQRVLEVSIPLQGGISGAPILNQWSEVIGLLTFSLERRQESASGQIHSDRSFYAIPVELLRRLRAAINNEW